MSLLDTTVIDPYPWKTLAKLLVQPNIRWGDALELRTEMLAWCNRVFEGNANDYLAARGTPLMQFANYKLSDTEKGDYAVWIGEQNGDTIQALTDVVASGYKLTTSYDDKNQCFIVSLIGRQEGHPNQDICMSTRHGDLAQAIGMALYKELVLFAGSAWVEATLNSDWG
jgi:hypothetical protein